MVYLTCHLVRWLIWIHYLREGGNFVKPLLKDLWNTLSLNTGLNLGHLCPMLEARSLSFVACTARPHVSRKVHSATWQMYSTSNDVLILWQWIIVAEQGNSLKTLHFCLLLFSLFVLHITRQIKPLLLLLLLLLLLYRLGLSLCLGQIDKLDNHEV